MLELELDLADVECRIDLCWCWRCCFWFGFSSECPWVCMFTLNCFILAYYESFFEFLFECGMNRWTINNKYYTADVSLWMAHLHDDFSAANVTLSRRMTALVMVFDMNEVSSFAWLNSPLICSVCVVSYLILDGGFIFTAYCFDFLVQKNYSLTIFLFSMCLEYA